MTWQYNSMTWEEHSEHLRHVFTCLRKANLTLKMTKCQFGRHQVEYLGYVVGDRKVLPNPKKIQAVLHYKQPVMKTEVKAFLGLSGYSTETTESSFPSMLVSQPHSLNC